MFFTIKIQLTMWELGILTEEQLSKWLRVHELINRKQLVY